MNVCANCLFYSLHVKFSLADFILSLYFLIFTYHDRGITIFVSSGTGYFLLIEFLTKAKQNSFIDLFHLSALKRIPKYIL